MKISFLNSRETSSFGVTIRYFQIGEETIAFGEEISEGDNVVLSGSRLVSAPDNDDECWLINLIGDSVFLTKGDVLHKGAHNNNRISVLVKVPINGWALTYDSYYDEFTLYRFTPDGVEWVRGTDADVVTAFYGIEFPIEVRIEEEEGDE